MGDGIALLGAPSGGYIDLQWGRDFPDNPDFEIGTAHYREVMFELGPPSKLSAIGGGLVFLYETADYRFWSPPPIRTRGASASISRCRCRSTLATS